MNVELVLHFSGLLEFLLDPGARSEVDVGGATVVDRDLSVFGRMFWYTHSLFPPFMVLLKQGENEFQPFSFSHSTHKHNVNKDTKK